MQYLHYLTESGRRSYIPAPIRAPVLVWVPPPYFQFVIALDFEATCWSAQDPTATPRKTEIIEFSAVLYHVEARTIVSEFQQFVRPTERPVLSEFCTRLTGIGQAQVEAGVPLAECLGRYREWHEEQCRRYLITFEPEKRRTENLCAFMTWSDVDLGRFLDSECRRKGIEKMKVFDEWMDIRRLFHVFYGIKPGSLQTTLKALRLQFEGKPHSGLDDARNTTRLLEFMVRQHAPLYINGKR